MAIAHRITQSRWCLGLFSKIQTTQISLHVYKMRQMISLTTGCLIYRLSYPHAMRITHSGFTISGRQQVTYGRATTWQFPFENHFIYSICALIVAFYPLLLTILPKLISPLDMFQIPIRRWATGGTKKALSQRFMTREKILTSTMSQILTNFLV